MKSTKLIFFYFLLFAIQFIEYQGMAQCDTVKYRQLIKEGDGYLNPAKPNYQKAMNAYSAAMIVCKEKIPEVQKKIITLFDKINQLKTRAELAEKKADSARKLAEDILGQLYFYDNKFALAVKKVGSWHNDTTKYGFINRQGETVIDFIYESAIPFDDPGFAKVKWKKNNYFIDTTGKKKYLLCDDLNNLNDMVEAIDLRDKGLKEFPEKIFQCKKLKILLLSKNQITHIPDHNPWLSDSLLLLDLSGNTIDSLPSR